MEQRQLKVMDVNKTFFSKVTSAINKLLIPTKVGFNSIMISIKRSSVLKAYNSYIDVDDIEDSDKKESIQRRYEESYALYLESIDRYIMDSIYKKVKRGIASPFEANALSRYYSVVHLKETEYIEYKYQKQRYLLDLDYETVDSSGKQKLWEEYSAFYASKMDVLFKGLLKHFSVQLADSFNKKEEVYDKIFECLENYISIVLPIKLEIEEEDKYKEILQDYQRLNRYKGEGLSKQEYVERNAILLGISRHLFVHSLPLVAAEQCYVKLLRDARSVITDTTDSREKKKAYDMTLGLIEEYNVKLLSLKVYWDKPELREEYKEFWKKYKEIESIKEKNSKDYEKLKEVLFVKYDLMMLNRSKKDYKKIIGFYKDKLVKLGVMRQFKDTYKSYGMWIKNN